MNWTELNWIEKLTKQLHLAAYLQIIVQNKYSDKKMLNPKLVNVTQTFPVGLDQVYINEIGRFLHKSSQYTAPFILSLLKISRPVPSAENKSHSMKFPPHCFTVGMVFMEFLCSPFQHKHKFTLYQKLRFWSHLTTWHSHDQNEIKMDKKPHLSFTEFVWKEQNRSSKSLLQCF